jgi:hypothetical protein
MFANPPDTIKLNFTKEPQQAVPCVLSPHVFVNRSVTYSVHDFTSFCEWFFLNFSLSGRQAGIGAFVVDHFPFVPGFHRALWLCELNSSAASIAL